MPTGIEDIGFPCFYSIAEWSYRTENKHWLLGCLEQGRGQPMLFRCTEQNYRFDSHPGSTYMWCTRSDFVPHSIQVAVLTAISDTLEFHSNILVP